MKSIVKAQAVVLATLLLASLSCKRSSSNPASSESRELKPLARPVGTPAGPATTATVGPGGGALRSSDGRLTISIPPGALSGDTPFSVQSLNNAEPNGVGPIYQLSPDGSRFAQPVMLAWQLSEADLAGRPLTGVTVATRDADGNWVLQPGVKRDAAAKTVRVATVHFSQWGLAWLARLPNLTIVPDTAQVPVTASLSLKANTATAALSDTDDDLTAPAPRSSNESAAPAPQGQSDDDDLLAAPMYLWRVNGNQHGDSTWGRISMGGDQATYSAPAKVPPANPVVVSCEAGGKHAKIVAIAYITVIDKPKAWTGTVEYRYDESHQTTTGNVTNFAHETRLASGTVDLQPDSQGWGGVDGKGTGSLEQASTYGMKNALCHSDGGTATTGHLDVGASGFSGSGAGSISLNLHGENLAVKTHQAENCSKRGSSGGSNWNNGSFGVTCNFVGIDFVRGGTYTTDVPADQGHGTCKVTIAPR
jgi:hypothetical protein